MASQKWEVALALWIFMACDYACALTKQSLILTPWVITSTYSTCDTVITVHLRGGGYRYVSSPPSHGGNDRSVFIIRILTLLAN